MLLFELVQVAIGTRDALSKVPSVEDWDVLYEEAQRQAVVDVAFEGVQRLPKEQWPPRMVRLQWIAVCEQIKARNRQVNRRSGEVTALFAEAGFKSCILKGQGNALMYPNPDSRMSGDVDIWIDGTREEINGFVRERCPDAFEQDLHIEFPIFKDVAVEVHYKPSYSSIPRYDKRLQAWFREQAGQQFTHRVMLGDSEVCIPTTAFNVVQQMSHVMGHFFVEGIGLRHFVDYYYVLRKLHEEQGTENYEPLFERLGLLKFARGVMWVEHEVLGLDEHLFVCEPDGKVGRVILKEIVEGGNFGLYDQRYAFRNKGYVARGLTDTYRLLKLTGSFPEEALWKIVRKVENQKWKVKREKWKVKRDKLKVKS